MRSITTCAKDYGYVIPVSGDAHHKVRKAVTRKLTLKERNAWCVTASATKRPRITAFDASMACVAHHIQELTQWCKLAADLGPFSEEGAVQSSYWP